MDVFLGGGYESTADMSFFHFMLFCIVFFLLSFDEDGNCEYWRMKSNVFG